MMATRIPNKEILYELQARGCSMICAFEEIRLAQEGNHVSTPEYELDFDPIAKEFILDEY